ncbi:hypothetical protein RIR_jg17367.t1 [Rhizophagus irregularis DAOM 181602=DAOM 197198]|nr:hypothetical protein RIR_jg17367.t1 [Rhizophagus irregularis DAOM 181602=DAOM 197198]
MFYFLFLFLRVKKVPVKITKKLYNRIKSSTKINCKTSRLRDNFTLVNQTEIYQINLFVQIKVHLYVKTMILNHEAYLKINIKWLYLLITLCNVPFPKNVIIMVYYEVLNSIIQESRDTVYKQLEYAFAEMNPSRRDYY